MITELRKAGVISEHTKEKLTKGILTAMKAVFTSFRKRRSC